MSTTSKRISRPVAGRLRRAVLALAVTALAAVVLAAASKASVVQPDAAAMRPTVSAAQAHHAVRASDTSTDVGKPGAVALAPDARTASTGAAMMR